MFLSSSFFFFLVALLYRLDKAGNDTFSFSFFFNFFNYCSFVLVGQSRQRHINIYSSVDPEPETTLLAQSLSTGCLPGPQGPKLLRLSLVCCLTKAVVQVAKLQH